MPESVSVRFSPAGRVAEVDSGRTVLDAALEAGIPLASVCGGEGTCGRCRIAITEPDPPPPTAADRRVLGGAQLEAGERLACLVPVFEPLRIAVPPASLVQDRRLQTEGAGGHLALDPAVRSQRASVARPSLEDARSDSERVVATDPSMRIDPDAAVLAQLTALLRTNDWQVDLIVRGKDVIGALPPDLRLFGLAVDLGTTKIAGYLMDLADGTEVATSGVANPQAHFGADVIARLAHAARAERGAEKLARTVRSALDKLLGRLCDEAAVGREQVADICIVGNTAMHHLLLELPTRQLSHAPFVAAIASAMDVRARDLGLVAAPGARVHLLPNVRGFVGGDAVAMMLGLDLDRVEATKVAVDIGTNTEIVLRRPDAANLAVASCASGPAFEGGHIHHGMSAASGAIERVDFDATGRPSIETIGHAPPLGICGSGILDAVAGLLRLGLIGSGGRLRGDVPAVRRGEHDLEVVLVQAAESGTGRDIVVTQADIVEIQLAKGAIAAGIEVLLEATATAPEAIDEVVLAGAFGTYLDIDSALDTGLLPRLPTAAYVQVGNAAGVGARAALLSMTQRARAQEVAAAAEYIELTTRPGFRRRFAHAMRFVEASSAVTTEQRAI